MKRYVVLILSLTLISFVYSKISYRIIKRVAPKEHLDGFCSKVARYTKAEIKQPSFPIKRIGKVLEEEFRFKFVPFLLLSLILMSFQSIRSSLITDNDRTRKKIIGIFTLASLVVVLFFGLEHGNYLNIFQHGVTNLSRSILIIVMINDSLKYVQTKNPEQTLFSPYRIHLGLIAGYIAAATSHTIFNLTHFYLYALS